MNRTPPLERPPTPERNATAEPERIPGRDLRPAPAGCALAALALAVLAGCGSSTPPGPATAVTPAARAAAPVAPRRVTITVIGTSDLHGHIDMLPILAGYLANLRSVRAPGSVVLLDGGDMFQGTLESNLNEGAAVVQAYNRLGYTAVAIGNHEFDFGPAGERVTPSAAGDDPRGALRARAAEARFPFLAANLIDQATHQPVSWPNVKPSILIEREGVKIGVIGIATEDTPHTTMARNFDGLSIAPLAATITSRAAALRQEGAQLVFVTAHAGGRCRDLQNPTDLASCEPDHEMFRVARELPPGTVDVIVGGHTHSGVAHEVNGIAFVQSFANGVGFGRVDLVVEPGGRGFVERRIHPTRFLCGSDDRHPTAAGCPPGEYEGKPVQPDAELVALMGTYEATARQVRDASLGVTVDQPIKRSRPEESALGNLFVDLMRVARPDADVAITNGGGLRADIPAGPLTYGRLHTAMPFDNRFARMSLTGAQLRRIVTGNLQKESGIFLVSGVRVTARCKGAALDVVLRRERGGKIVRDADRLTIVTSDFLAGGGDGMLEGLDLAEGAVKLEEGETIRDALAATLRKRGGRLSGTDPKLFDPARPRFALPGPRPVRCDAK
jgi:5'-nucleotidase